MKKKNIAILILALLLCAALVTLLVIKKPWQKNEADDVPSFSEVDPGTAEAPTEDTTVPTTDPTTEPAPTEAPLSEQILGLWTGGIADVSSYEFLSDGTVLLRLVDLDQLLGADLPIDTGIHGDYTLSGDQLKINYRVGTTRYTYEFTVTVSDDTLTLFSKGDGVKSTFHRSKDAPVDTNALREDLIGAWTSADDTVNCTFRSDGALSVTLKDAVLPGRRLKLTGTADGLYELQSSTLTLQFLLGDETVTVRGTCDVNRNQMSLTAADGSAMLFRRTGTQPDEATAPESLRGTWKSADGTAVYTFNEGNVFSVTYTDCSVPALSKSISGTYQGVYTLEGTALRLMYTAFDTHITEDWTLSSQEDGKLEMTDSASGVTRTLTR